MDGEINAYRIWYAPLGTVKITARSRVLLAQLVKKLPILHVTLRFIAVFTRTGHWSLP
jgi:hypothetical protein